jgi:hypothetical protein
MDNPTPVLSISEDTVCFCKTTFAALSAPKQMLLLRSFNRAGFDIEAAYLAANEERLKAGLEPSPAIPCFPVLQTAQPHFVTDGKTGQTIVVTMRMLEILRRFNQIGGRIIDYNEAARISKQWWRPVNWYCRWRGWF